MLGTETHSNEDTIRGNDNVSNCSLELDSIKQNLNDKFNEHENWTLIKETK